VFYIGNPFSEHFAVALSKSGVIKVCYEDFNYHNSPYYLSLLIYFPQFVNNLTRIFLL
jgi:hypothetical protein